MPIRRRDLIAAGAAAPLPVEISRIEAARPTTEALMTALAHIQQIDYTVIFTRNLQAMREFYEGVMEFAVGRVLGDAWIEYRVGPNILALTAYGNLFSDTPPPLGALSLQLAFRVPPPLVQECAAVLEAKGIRPVLPVTDQPWGHRTVFLRDPDGNVLEIFAEI